MALDVYVGTMTRFYRREWENVAQQYARRQGTQYKMIYAGGKPEPPPAADTLREVVAKWSAAISEGLQPHGYGPVSWDEADGQGYFTDRPAWDGYSALLLWAAYEEHPDLAPPSNVPDSWVDDPAFQRSIQTESKTRYRTILEPQLWLPCEFPFVFTGPTLATERECIGSVFTLREQLDVLFSRTSEKLRMVKAEPEEIPDSQKPTLAEMAAFSLGIFRDLAAKACEHRLPMVLHF